MGNPKAFLTVKRKEAGYRPRQERILDFGEVEQTLNSEDRQQQASRCMDCGIPFCQWGCPLGNKMPEWQDYIYKGNWRLAAEVLMQTNDFPEFTGRICPAPCEKTCVLSLHKSPVTIRENEASALEHAFQEGYIKPFIPKVRTGKKVAVIGSGPSGMAVANQLNRMGHEVTVYEKSSRIGGLLRFGIPDFKLNKNIIDRRLELMEAEGIKFVTNTEVGIDIKGKDLVKNNDAICVAIGSQVPRDLPVEGRGLKGVYYAMEYLTMKNRLVAKEEVSADKIINTEGKNVLVIGGGDTGSDCIGTANRQKAANILQIEIMPKPPTLDELENSWPMPFPGVLKTSSSHLEGCERRWSMNTKRFIGENGILTGVELVEIAWEKDEAGKMVMKEVGEPEILKIDYVFLALGFIHPIQDGLLAELGVKVDDVRKNITTDVNRLTNVSKVFAAGDCVSGQSLVVTSIASGRRTAKHINDFLKTK
ncbi:glutamate synthase (NADPH/NADH) small chain [Dysgonomonas alginatilytica]|uniref:Glutamate synthase (NADPH/NADH) small chain n=1 Tax=Dysgonomonas alginatilytica TaxID=1605892 RepID=A0A2V3PQZ2_9BACT|nr:glutamate synthase subunit beta [Dysgonomonas alginatilytica]PXV64404.1 glutamate synthase (NADPH/NADH) small chain [Dysgonomonas alginatilytica]